MRIACFSPIANDALLRSSELTRSLLANKPEHWDVEVFTDDLGLQQCGNLSVSHYLRAYEKHQRQPFDFFLFQLEDHPRCRFVTSALSVWPGVCFFHDVNLNRLYFDRLKHSSAADEFNQEMDRLFGVDSIRVGDWHVRGRSLDCFDKVYVRGQLELEKASLPLVSDGDIGKEISNEVEVLPFDLAFETGSLPKYRVREEFTFVGFCGEYRLADRWEESMRAFLDFRSKALEISEAASAFCCHWIVPDADVERVARKWLQRFCRRQDVDPDIFSLRRVCSKEALLEQLLEVDALLALRFAPFRGHSVVLQQAINLGVPLVVGDLGLQSRLPGHAVARVVLDGTEQEQLVEVLLEFSGNKALREQLAGEVASFGASRGSLELLLGQLESLLGSKSDLLAKQLATCEGDVSNIKEKMLSSLREQMPEMSQAAIQDFFV